MVLTEAQRSHFRKEGFVVLEAALNPSELAGLRDECARRYDTMRSQMDAVGADTLGLTHRDRRYFLHAPHQESEFLSRFLFRDTVVGPAAALLGPDVYLFLELFVLKCGIVGSAMAWHQDGGYLMGTDHQPYLSIWIALDDMSSRNGTLAVLPFPRAGGDALVEHVRDPRSNDRVGYTGADVGEVLEVPAGSMVLMASTLLHRSLPNADPAPRRAFLVSYSAAPITGPDGALWNMAEPCRGRHA